MADLIDILQLDHLVCQQPQGPALLAFWSGTARQCNQMGFFLSRDAPSLWARLGILAVESGLQSLFREAFFDANDGTTADLKRLGNLPIGRWWLGLTAIQFE